MLDLVEDGEPWKKQEIQHLINTEFDIEYHPNHLPPLLDDLGHSVRGIAYERPDRPENTYEMLDERVGNVFAKNELNDPHNKRKGEENDEVWTVGDDVLTDSGNVVRF